MTIGFQQGVALYPAVGVWGARASMNPTATVDAGAFNPTAGALGVTVGKFAWQSYVASTGLATVNNYSTTAPILPDGFIANEQQALITTWLGVNGMGIPAGYPVTMFNRGDFWAKTVYADAAIGQKVFANLFSGDVYPAAAGAFVTANVGTAAVVVASVTSMTTPFLLTIASVTSGVVAVGQQISGTGLNPEFPTYIESFGTFNGSAGTVNLALGAVNTTTSQSYSTIANIGIGGCVCSSVSSASSTTMTINTITSGQIAVGQQVQAITNVPTGTYIASLGTFNGTSGTIILSQATTGTITAQACSFSSFIETPWYFNSAGNVGDLVKIGTRW